MAQSSDEERVPSYYFAANKGSIQTRDISPQERDTEVPAHSLSSYRITQFIDDVEYIWNVAGDASKMKTSNLGTESRSGPRDCCENYRSLRIRSESTKSRSDSLDLVHENEFEGFSDLERDPFTDEESDHESLCLSELDDAVTESTDWSALIAGLPARTAPTLEGIMAEILGKPSTSGMDIDERLSAYTAQQLTKGQKHIHDLRQQLQRIDYPDSDDLFDVHKRTIILMTALIDELEKELCSNEFGIDPSYDPRRLINAESSVRLWRRYNHEWRKEYAKRRHDIKAEAETEEEEMDLNHQLFCSFRDQYLKKMIVAGGEMIAGDIASLYKYFAVQEAATIRKTGTTMELIEELGKQQTALLSNIDTRLAEIERQQNACELLLYACQDNARKVTTRVHRATAQDAASVPELQKQLMASRLRDPDMIGFLLNLQMEFGQIILNSGKMNPEVRKMGEALGQFALSVLDLYFTTEAAMLSSLMDEEESEQAAARAAEAEARWRKWFRFRYGDKHYHRRLPPPFEQF